KIELIDGTLRFMMTKGTAHDSTVDKVARRLARLLPDWQVRVQSAISSTTTEPEPDVVVAVGPEDRYDDHHPRPHEIALLVEVADSSVHADRGTKKRAYANAGIVEYWVVAIPDRTIDVYTDPTGPHGDPAYRQERQYRPDESVPVRVHGREVGRIAVGEVM